MSDCHLNTYYSNNKPDGVSRYNTIPKERVYGKILDIGCSDGIAQINSRHGEYFKSENYLGLEPASERAEHAIHMGLNVLLTTIDNYDMAQKFDLIIMNEVIAHIDYEEWAELFKKLKSLLNKGGTICITTIANEKFQDAGNVHRYHHHVVMDITDDMILEHLPSATIIKIPAWHAFKQKDESFLWALGRWVKRIITRHPAVGLIFPARREKMYLYR
ncbi:hypothetical protein LCGC14_0303260 [marine sediment metagenome]|uniref:Methyltransferase type 11 domain-containing protein n=1 Tax=marine sediment metagenome TaxID=412755 RepID=A0A0F9TPR4_9ZZZZ